MNYFFARKFIHYMIFSWHKNGHGIHSPFVFDLITKGFKTEPTQNVENLMREMYERLRVDNSIVEKQDLGAGSVKKNLGTCSVARISKTSSSPRKYGKLLYQLTSYYKPSIIIELGTCLGVSSSWMALGCPEARIISLEGNEKLAQLAQQNHEKSGLKNIEVMAGEFSTTLPVVLRSIRQVDVVFFDGNHREESTIQYFEQCVNKACERSIFIFDDIYWSEEMERAWIYVKKHPRVTFTVDLCRLGIVFFNQKASKQHFVIRY